MSRHWILVAGATSARMFESLPNDLIQPLENWADEGGQLKKHELETDGEGKDDVGVAVGHPDHQNH